MQTQVSSMAYRQHPYFTTRRDEDHEAFLEEVARIVADSTPTTIRHGVRVLASGQVQTYII